MAVNRSYLAVSGVIALSASSVPLIYFAPPSTADANIAKVKIMVPGSSGATPADNADVLAYLYKVTGTVAGGTAITPAQLGGNALAANTVVETANASTGLTGLTQSGSPLWVGDIPQTSGSSWADDHENTGLEVALLPSVKYALYVGSAAGAGTDMNAEVGVWFFE